MQQYRFYILLISFLIGIASATIVGTSLQVITWLCLIAFGLVIIGGRRSGASSTATLLTLSFALCFFALGLLRFEVASWQFGQSVFEAYVGKEVSLQGVVVREPDVREQTTQLYLEVQEELLLVSTDKNTPVSYGDEVTVKGELRAPEAFTTELGRTFNYPAYLLARGVEYQISFAEVTVDRGGHGFLILHTLFATKHALMDSIESVLQEPYAGLGEGLLLGVKQALGEDLESIFRTSGIIHIVVLSGYNVMLVVTFILYLLSIFFKKKTRIIIGMIAIVAFALLVGLSATVVRASIMAGLLLFADMLGRRYDLTRALLFAATIMVVLNPYLLVYDIGFQLSFMATVGLILIAPTFESFVTDGFSKLQLKDFFVSTLATQIAVLPLLVYHIGEVSLVAVVVNVLVLPIVPLAMLLTFLAGVLGLVSYQLAMFVGFFAYVTLRYIIEVAAFFAQVPFASVVIPEISGWMMGCLYVLLAFVLYFLRRSVHEKSNIADWVIEEEPEKMAEEINSSATQSETPLFFR